jgi:NAD+ synthase (glutamine-hydrolysing)
MALVTLAAATLPSIPLDFGGNRDRILESIRIAKARGATLRTGPELEIPGYGCLDHHLEGDTFAHSWEVLADIISDDVCRDMLVDLGLGVRHRNVRYNARVLCTYKRIFCIRPKMSLANDGLYREARHFSAWAKPREVEDYYLEAVVAKVTGQRKVPIGDLILSTLDTAVTCESCEEMFVPMNPSIFTGLNGAEIILNSSASHAELRKLKTRLDLIANSTRKLGGIYVYANATGVDGEARMLFDGSSMVVQNGEVMAQGSQFSLRHVEVTVATVNIERVRSFRSSISRNVQAARQPDYPRVECDLMLSRPAEDMWLSGSPELSRAVELRVLDPMEEIYMAQATYLWQYLTRTNSAGYFLALSGGLDSATVAVFVYGMARLVLQSMRAGEEETAKELARVTGDADFAPHTAQEIVNRLFHTCYMPSRNSTDETRRRAEHLSATIGAHHTVAPIDGIVAAFEAMVQTAVGITPRYQLHGGTYPEDLAKQNVQARTRMVTAYNLAQLSTTARGLPRAGATLLVLGAGNVDENLRGYYTKYDASSADLAPLGSISKNDAKAFLRWARDAWQLPALGEVLDARPSAELRPVESGEQDDEADTEMGMTYDELSAFGVLRKVDKLGPWSTYQRLLSDWHARPGYGPRQIAHKVKHFFKFYAINRHKTTVITPSPHMSAYNPDDNRHDLRPFLYNVQWPWQFAKIDRHVEELEKARAAAREGGGGE